MLLVTRRCLRYTCAVVNSASTTAVVCQRPLAAGRTAVQFRHYATPTEVYQERLGSGELKEDATQERVVADLQTLYDLVHSSGGGGGGSRSGTGNILSRLFSRGAAAPATKGLYIFGSVGGGKTTLMDLFYDCCTVIARAGIEFCAAGVCLIHICSCSDRSTSGSASTSTPLCATCTHRSTRRRIVRATGAPAETTRKPLSIRLHRWPSKLPSARG